MKFSTPPPRGAGYALLFCFLLLIVAGCKKQETFDDLTEANVLKNFYQQNIMGKNSGFESTQPIWEKAYKNAISDSIDVYEVALQNPKKVGIVTGGMTDEKLANFDQNHDLRLLFFVEHTTQKVKNACYMALETDVQAKPADVHYIQWGNNSGKTIYYYTNGNFANGLVYQNGKPTFRIKGSTKEQFMLAKKNQLRKETLGCTGYWVEKGFNECPTLDGEISGNCRWHSNGWSYQTVCVDEGGAVPEELQIPNPPGFEDAGGGGGGGGGEGSSEPPQGEQATNIDLSLFDRLQYPQLAKVIDGLYNKVKNDPKLMEALKKFTHLSENQILANLISGQGPRLVVEVNGTRAGGYDPVANELKISQHLVEAPNMQPLINDKFYTALEFYITVTVLHEFIHFGEDTSLTYLPHEGNTDDAGFQFENNLYGGKVFFNYATGQIKYEKL